ncbi:MAG: universal stress protein [Thermoleophilaceae bacterium]|nr:universal stress protein [Thermoleophilaceae bacterium]
MTTPRRLLVGHDGSPASTEALRHAASLARASHGRLTVVLALPRVACAATFAPVSVPTVEREAQEAAEGELARAVAALDRDVSVTTIVTCQCFRRALVRAWRCGDHDAVVLAAGGPLSSRRRAARALRRLGVEPIVVGAAPRSRPARRRRRRTRPARRARPA